MAAIDNNAIPNVEAQADAASVATSDCQCGTKDYKDQVQMESGGTIDMDQPGYVTDDDVKDAIAEGYY